MRGSVTLGSISPQRPAPVSLALPKSMTHKHIGMDMTRERISFTYVVVSPHCL